MASAECAKAVQNVVSTSYNVVAVVTQEGNVVCWGSCKDGQCNIHRELDNQHVIAVSCGCSHVVALLPTGSVVCWGDNSDEKCTAPGDLENVVGISCGYHHTAALKGDGTVVCWGRSREAQCDVPSGLNNAVAVGIAHRCWYKMVVWLALGKVRIVLSQLQVRAML
jgi:alpha-tubulin suppressor-like RCC1 family protein